MSSLIAFIEETHNLVLKAMGTGSLELTLLCPSLDSLESLWRDYQSGHLNRIAERYLVTDDIKRKLNLTTVRLKTTIEKENYRSCKKILMEKSCEFGSPLKVYVRANSEMFNWRGLIMCTPLKLVISTLPGVNLTKLLQV